MNTSSATLTQPNHEEVSALLNKYNVQVPRYTSYPSVPHWSNFPKEEEWEALVRSGMKSSKEGISLYIHLPFCERLCTYCGCNTRITVNHQVEEPYILSVLKEWEHYVSVFKERPLIKELHLGGGTPTFFTPGHLVMLLSGIFAHADIAKNPEFSLEAHPGVTTRKHLEVLAELGFTRLSLGVQDFNPSILEAINRKQTLGQIEQVTRDARSLGFTSINYDFVYGLPFQKKEDIIRNVEYVSQLKPDRIAFYSYAHVPWKKGGQRKFTEADLPEPAEKFEMYETGKNLFMQLGYKEIGMDHFALPNDELYKAKQDKTLSRNFMGYIPHSPNMLIGLGCSSISDTNNCYVQNHPVVEDYMTKVNSNLWAFVKGHRLSEEELRVKKHITGLMCNFETSWNESEDDFFHQLKDKLTITNAEGITEVKGRTLKIKHAERHLVRNVCALIDPYIARQTEEKNRFSKAI
jgi:oxygen-independent coproporphyrinogen-3 oxidase